MPAVDPSYATDPMVLLYLAAAILVVGQAWGVFLYERFSVAGRRFLVLALVGAAWMVPLGLSHGADTASVRELWVRGAYLAIPLTVPALYWLASAISPTRTRPPAWVLWLFGAGFLALNTAGPWLVDGLRSLLIDGQLVRGYGWIAPVYLGLEVAGIGLTFRLLLRSRRGAFSGEERQEKIAMALSAALGSLTLLDYRLAADPFRAGVMTPIAILAAVTVITFAALRYRVFAPAQSIATGEVLRAMSDAVLVCDGVGVIRASNRAARRLLGRSERHLIGKPVGWFVGVDEDGKWRPWAPLGGSVTEELDLRSESGESIRVSASVEPIRFGGRPGGAVIVARDLRQRLRTERELEVQRRYFADLFASSPEGIVLVEAETDRVLRMNQEFSRLFGYTEEEAVGVSLNDLIVPEDRLGEATAMSRQARAGGRVRDETVRQRKDGTLVEVSVLARKLEIPGEPTQLYGVYRDITDRKETERALQAREEELRHTQKLEAVGKLAGGVAHDFNNLLTVINGHARFVLEKAGKDSELAEDLIEIEKAGTRAAALTQQLLAYSRRQVLHPKVLDPNQVIRELQGMLRRLIGEHIRVETTLTDEELRVRADRGQLEQVLINLVVNARDAMPDGGTLKLETQAVRLSESDDRIEQWELRPGAFVRIRISDTGFGMDAETLERAFDPFFTTKEPGKGTGLGLATVFGIVKQSGGHVRARSVPGAGTTCEVILPAVEGPTATEKQTRGLERREGAAAGGTILVVEDEPAVRKLAVRVLERDGYQVLSAENGARALEVLETHGGPVDLVLTDMVMPEMGGEELAWHLSRRRPGLPILFMSGYDDALVGEDGESGAEFLAKPFTPAMLAERVAESLKATA